MHHIPVLNISSAANRDQPHRAQNQECDDLFVMPTIAHTFHTLPYFRMDYLAGGGIMGPLLAFWPFPRVRWLERACTYAMRMYTCTLYKCVQFLEAFELMCRKVRRSRTGWSRGTVIFTPNISLRQLLAG